MADADTASAPAEADGWAPPESMYLADHFQQDITQLRCLRCGNEAAYDARSGRAAPSKPSLTDCLLNTVFYRSVLPY